jgi:formate dehydrogenase maturation protein FdhE
MTDRRQRIGGVVESKWINLQHTAETDEKRIAKVEAQARALPQAVSWNECPLCGSFLTGPLHRSDDGHGYNHLICSKCKFTWTPGLDR